MFIEMSIQFTYGNDVAGTADADVVVAFVSKQELGAAAAQRGSWIHPAFDEAMQQHAAKELFKGDPKETLVLPTLGLYPASHVVYVGIAPPEALTTDGLRDAAAAAAKAAKRLKAITVKQLLPAWLAPVVRLGESPAGRGEAAEVAIGAANAPATGQSAAQPGFTAKQAAQALTEGYVLGLYTRTTAKKVETRRKSLITDVAFVPAVAPLAAVSAPLAADANAENVDSGAADSRATTTTMPNSVPEAAPGPVSETGLEGVPEAGSGVAASSINAAETSRQWEAGIRRGVVAAEAVTYARDLTNLPGNSLVPTALAAEAERLAQAYGMRCEIIDEVQAEAQGMGGLIGVGKGSLHPPRMIVIHYDGNANDGERWGIVGKGITFDTGGISLKKGPGMEEMISDMGGAATVLGLVRIFGERKPKRNAVFVIPSAENMPSDRAFKPGDILTMMNGTTVEIVNTDAEGRLVLADGMTTAIRGGATKLIDIATLTGAVLVLLGDTATGSLANDETLQQQVAAAAKRAGERIWPLPPYPEFRRQLDSEAADMKNGGSRYGAASIGGLFIGAFAEDKPWVHLDIAGTAWLERDRAWEVKGGTGVMVRTLAELLTGDEE